MKLLSIICASILICAACNKDTKKAPEGCLKGKVVRITCASIVIQVLNDNSVGEDGWVDHFDNSKVYDNVFNAINSCELPSGWKVGDEFYFTSSTPSATGCMHCDMMDYPPAVRLDVLNVDSGRCGN